MGGRMVWVPVVSGPLAPYAAGFESWLASRAYPASAAADRLYQFDQLSRWLGREGLGAGDLTAEHAGRFAAGRRAAGLKSWTSPQSVALPLQYLRQLGLAPMPAPVSPQGPLEELLADYCRYLSVERGLSGHTVFDAYGPAARLFLSGREDPDGLGLDWLSAADVSSFLARECPERSMSGARDLACALRSLLRYLHLAGLTAAPLVWAVPSVADLRDRTLPRGLDPAAVRRLLASCDRRTLTGLRDFAILLLLSRLGLRAGEVAAITLGDLDWRSGLLLVHGKGSRREDALPLPVDHLPGRRSLELTRPLGHRPRDVQPHWSPAGLLARLVSRQLSVRSSPTWPLTRWMRTDKKSARRRSVLGKWQGSSRATGSEQPDRVGWLHGDPCGSRLASGDIRVGHRGPGGELLPVRARGRATGHLAQRITEHAVEAPEHRFGDRTL